MELDEIDPERCFLGPGRFSGNGPLGPGLEGAAGPGGMPNTLALAGGLGSGNLGGPGRFPKAPGHIQAWI